MEDSSLNHKIIWMEVSSILKTHEFIPNFLKSGGMSERAVFRNEYSSDRGLEELMFRMKSSRMAVASPCGSFKVLYILIPKSLDVSWHTCALI